MNKSKHDIEYIRAYISYKKMLKALEDLPREKRERIMNAYQVKKPSLLPNITYRNLEGSL